MKSLALTAVALIVTSSSVYAQSFAGGEAALSYSTYTGSTDGDALNFSGSLEFGITREFGIQADLAYTSFGDIGTTAGTDATSNAFVLHGIYNVNDSASVGAFFGFETFNVDLGAGNSKDNTNYAGIELGYEIGAVNFEMFYAKPLDEIIDNASFYGVSGEYVLSDAFAITADASRMTTDDLGASNTVAVGVAYDVMPNIAVGVEVGSASVDSDLLTTDSTFVSLGATFTLGAERGATFNSRGMTRDIPGF